MNESKHTSGLCVLRGVNDPPVNGSLVLDIGDICGAATIYTHCEEYWPRETQIANGRLLAASYNSYDKHCGPRAVECAEGDLLGEALEACEAFLEKWDRQGLEGFQLEKFDVDAQMMRTLLAKATSEDAEKHDDCICIGQADSTGRCELCHKPKRR